MQTVARLALHVLKWESVKLPNGAYRIQNASRLAEIPNLTEFIECTENGQFADELSCVCQRFKIETAGVWIGLTKGDERLYEVISMMLPVL